MAEPQLYALVETFENSKIYIQAVPHTWLNQDYLYWPPDATKATKLIQNYISPDPNAWNKIRFVKVHKYNIGQLMVTIILLEIVNISFLTLIESYTEARDKEITYSKHTNTSSEDEERRRKSTKRSHPGHLASDISDLNYNDVFDDVSFSPEKENMSPKRTPNSPKICSPLVMQNKNVAKSSFCPTPNSRSIKRQHQPLDLEKTSDDNSQLPDFVDLNSPVHQLSPKIPTIDICSSPKKKKKKNLLH